MLKKYYLIDILQTNSEKILLVSKNFKIKNISVRKIKPENNFGTVFIKNIETVKLPFDLKMKSSEFISINTYEKLLKDLERINKDSLLDINKKEVRKILVDNLITTIESTFTGITFENLFGKTFYTVDFKLDEDFHITNEELLNRLKTFD